MPSVATGTDAVPNARACINVEEQGEAESTTIWFDARGFYKLSEYLVERFDSVPTNWLDQLENDVRAMGDACLVLYQRGPGNPV